MSNEQEDFSKLRLLLSVKRHEQPPPGYFDRLPRDIMSRIRAGEAAGNVSVFERLAWDAPWLHRLWSALETKPVVAGTLGVAVSGLLLAAIAFNMSPEAQPIAGMSANQNFLADPTDADTSPMDLVSMPVLGSTALFASTGSVVSLAPQLMPHGRHPYAMPLSAEVYR